ncbi:MAG: NYN domain-containing protein [Hyphomicrobiaceae bacterium]|nr:NYN domain-containing protein [Hyphomicrobiaceae bacterium]
MKRESGGPCLSAVFVDYDNIYLSLKRKSEDAAKKFAKDAGSWLRQIESGRLITPTNGPQSDVNRRIVMNRCYGNPVPRRNPQDNSTDMNSFPFVRHHFLRAGFEIIDCPPLTAQLKNSSDIRMVMDVRDFLTHETYFDEFIILSGDADFTPVLHRLRAHARRTVIFANDYTAAPYTAISDGEVREADLLAFLVDGRLPGEEAPALETDRLDPGHYDAIRREITEEIMASVNAATAPVPIEALADRALRALGHDRTIGTSWAGFGAFRAFLQANLPESLKLSEQPPYVVYDPRRHLVDIGDMRPVRTVPQEPPSPTPPIRVSAPVEPPTRALPPVTRPSYDAEPAAPRPMAHAPTYEAPRAQAAPAQPASETPRSQPQARPQAENPSALQQSIARIHEACQAPPLAPPEYRQLFEAMSSELTENGLAGSQTVSNIAQRVQNTGLDVRRDDVRFVLEVISEADPWFEQGVSANLFAGRFRNFVVARCRSQGLNLSAEELDLIDAWFAGGQHAPPIAKRPVVEPAGYTQSSDARQPQRTTPTSTPGPMAAEREQIERWWTEPRQATGGGIADTNQGHTAPTMPGSGLGDELPRIVRSRQRG